MLAWTIYSSFIGVAVLMLLPRENARAARSVALLTASIGLFLALGAIFEAKAGELVPIAKIPWIPSLGIEYHLAADGISLVLVLLTGIAAVVGILFSWNIELRAKEFFAFYLALIGGVYGVFLSFDLFLLFVFYELAIIPKYFLIAIWGSTRREYGAMKLALYSFIGSAMVLIGIIAAYVVSGAKTMNLFELAKFPFPDAFQMWAFPLVFVGFGILAGLWPFHTWAPTGHVAAPTAASMLLAGVVMKLGAYGCLRVAMTLFPHGLDPWTVTPYCPGLVNSLSSHSLLENLQWALHLIGLGSWRDVFSVLAVIGIVYGATVALVQKDFKFVIGYSSVSHMGFVLLGLMTLTTIGLSGAVLQMFSHGIIASLLFAVVGRMVYDRTHTRELDELAPNEFKPPAAIRRGDVYDRRRCLDGFAWIQRVHCRAAGPARRLASLPHARGDRRLGGPHRRRLHFTGPSAGVLRGSRTGRGSCCRPRQRSPAPRSHNDARAAGRNLFDGGLVGDRFVPEVAAGFDRPQFQFRAV